jgi:hypothetical protein
MEEGTLKAQNSKCRLYWCLIKCIDWRYRQSVMLVFSTPLVSKRTEYRQCVAVGWGGGGVLSCVVDHILQEFNTRF